ncbi:MAG TPA: hypothetical protein VFB13_20690 [Reyranella sp.]|jgi:uncharacterized membrane protein YfbV (UPF0208 family)|nr:hypothetical protein [Reyranella sp.]
MRRFSFFLPVAVFSIAWTAISSAQTPPATASRFGLGDYMTAFVQPRHMKLGLAGQARNWDYLAYERSELDETFEMIEKQVPRYKGTAMAELLKLVDGPMEELDKAIKARDGARFDAAYARLTDGCNACHVTTEHKMVVIQAPKTSPFANQKLDP